MNYEYKQLELSGAIFKSGFEKIEKELNELGSRGWELVGFTARSIGEGYVYVFKREVAVRKDS